jgi:hypothetical protein
MISIVLLVLSNTENCAGGSLSPSCSEFGLVGEDFRIAFLPVEVGLKETLRAAAVNGLPGMILSDEKPSCRLWHIGVAIDFVTEGVRTGETILVAGLQSRTSGLSGSVSESEEVVESKEHCLGRRSKGKVRR